MMARLRHWWQHRRDGVETCPECGLPEETRSVLDELLRRMDRMIAIERGKNPVEQTVFPRKGR